MLLMLSSFKVLSQEPNDCVNATVICGSINFSYTPTGSGTNDFASNPNPVCLPTGPVESQSVWLRVTIDNPGNLEFTLTPNNGTDDYDWAIFGPNVSCSTLGTSIRCSSTMFLGNGETGLGNGATDTSEGPGTGDAFLAPLPVNSGETYYIFINNYSSSSSGFDLDFGGTATFNPPPTNETPVGVSLDMEQCDTDGVFDGVSEFDLSINSPIITGAQTGVRVTYYESVGDALTANNAIRVPNAYNNNSSPQTIYARITDTTTGCFETTQFEIEVTNSLNIGVPDNLFICDADNDGLAQFNLLQNDTNIQNAIPNTVVSYYASQADALAQNSPLPGLYTNANAYVQETLWARLDDVTAGCFNIASFTIDVYNSPQINTVTDQLICDDDNDGFWSFDFSTLNTTVLGAQSGADYNVSYHSSQIDADNNDNALAIPYNNQLAFQTESIYVRLENVLNTECYVTHSFDITVFETPTANTVSDFELCDDTAIDGDDTNGIVSFDLSTRINTLLGTQLAADFEVKFYHSQLEADTGLGGEITAPIRNTTNPQIIYARVENRRNTNCYDTTPFNLVVNPLPVVNDVVSMTQCDSDADGFTSFNLTEANSLISANHMNENFRYYQNQADAIAGTTTGEILNFINYTNPAPLSSVYVRVATNNTCFRTARIDLAVGTSQIPTDGSFDFSFDVCDDDLIDINNSNGVAAFDFSSADAQFRAQYPLSTITYYNNEADALAEINAIADISNHRNDASPFTQQLFVRIDSDVVNGCLGLGPHITLNVNPQPNNNAITDYELCSDTNQAVFDLNTKDAEINFGQPRPVLISYHLSEQDAIANIAIANAANFTSGARTIWVRAEFVDNGNGIADECVRTDINFNLVVNPNPVIHSPDTIRICSDQITTVYDLTQRETQITGGDTSISLQYFESQLDMDTNNPILDPTQYSSTQLNNSILVLATGANLCTSTTTLNLLTILYANINQTPMPIEECEIDNNGYDFFDITRREMEILNGLNPADFTFTYYEDENDAIAGNANNIVNTANFENTVAVRQTLFVRVQPTANECFIVVPLEIIVNPVPEIGIEDRYVICLNSTDDVINPVNRTFLPNPPIDTQLSIADYSFQWYFGDEMTVNTDPNSVIITGATNATYMPLAEGFYTVIATNRATGCTIPATTYVEASYPPESIAVELLSEAFVSNNVLEVTVSGNGDYEFRLDFGPWQTGTRFENVTGGEHTVYVRDLFNCDEISEIQVVIDYPKYFTPNGDGYHDRWNIKGMATQPGATIYIFDRYGKLLKQLSPTGQGWDGTFNGERLPSSDYWFVVEYEEPSNGIKKQFKAHFSLKR